MSSHYVPVVPVVPTAYPAGMCGINREAIYIIYNIFYILFCSGITFATLLLLLNN